MFAASKSGGVVASAGDPYWTSVSLLTNFENNLSFQDGSTNNFAITRTGVVNPSLNTPFSGGVGGSQYFSGSGYLPIPNNVGLQLGSGNFTIEVWFYSGALSSIRNFFNTASGAGNTNLSYAIVTNSTACTYYLSSTGSSWDIASGISIGTVATNTWYHVALVRNGTTITPYLNGVAGTTTTSSATLFAFASTLGIGAYGSGVDYFFGNLSNVRIVKGTAVYTANFTPPIAPLTAIANTSLLITGTGQGMFNNATFVDQGPNALAVTATGAPVYSGLSPFGNTYPGSVLLNGTSQYLSGPNITALQMGTGDYTVEFWMYQNSVAGTQVAIEVGRPTPSGVGFQIDTVGGVINIYGGVSTATLLIAAGSTQVVNAWYHVALTRQSSSTKLFINGTQSGSTATDSTNYTQAFLWVGANAGGGSAYFNGYISNLRIVKGTAVYTANFTPPTTPLTAITNTSLLVRGDTGAFYDLSNNGLAMTANGATAKISVAASKFGTLSTVYDGTQSSAINVAISALLAMPGDFTFECWANVPTGTSQTLYAVIYSTTNTYIESNFAGTNNYTAYGVTPSFNINSGVAAKDSTWHFLALVRSGTTITFYVDGVNKGTTTTSTVVDLGSPTQARIGAGNNGAADNPFNGYIDSIRITKGVARYTANFTPPTVTFPTGP